MALLTTILMSISLTAMPGFAIAEVGGSNGGGGAQIESAFRLRANELIAKVAANPTANALCTATAMKEALLNTTIRVTKEIDDPRGRCKADQLFDACSYPGDMQLKHDSWLRFFDETKTRPEDRSVEALILHEVYRVTRDCNDEGFRLTDEALKALRATGAIDSEASLKVRWQSCFVTSVVRGKDKKVKTDEYSSEDTRLEWHDSGDQFVFAVRDGDHETGKQWGAVLQDYYKGEATGDPEFDRATATGTAFDIFDGYVWTEKTRNVFESRGTKDKFVITDVTHVDPARNLAKIYVEISPALDGTHVKVVQDQREPNPPDKNGNQRLSRKTICTQKRIAAEDINYSGVFKVKKQVQKFSKTHERTILAKNLLRACEKETPARDCALEKAAYGKAAADRLKIWNNLVKASDFETKSSDGGSSGGEASAGGKCSSMQGWFDACIYSRPNCPILPGSYCYGAAGWFERCTGRRAPRYCGQ